MQLFQRARLAAPRGGAEGSSPENDSPEKNGIEENALELWRGRRWLWAGYGLAAILLLVWGWVILPENGPLSWVWWPVALATIGAGGWLHWRQVQRAKGIVESGVLYHKSRTEFSPTEDQDQPSKRLRTETFPLEKKGWRRLPLGLGLILLVGLGLNLFIVVKYPQSLRFDGYEYSRIGYEYAQNGYRPDAVRSPGYTLLVAGGAAGVGVDFAGRAGAEFVYCGEVSTVVAVRWLRIQPDRV